MSLGSCGGSLDCTVAVVGFIRGRWVHWGTPWVSFGLSGVAGLIRVKPGGRRVHLGL